MADFVFNVAKGRAARMADLLEANDALGILFLKSAGVEAQSALEDHANVSVMLAAANDECDFTGYTRKTLSSVVVTTDNTNNRVEVDAADPTAYTNSGTAQAAAKAVVYHDNDTTGGSDTNLTPMVGLDAAITFDVSVPTTFAFGANGFYRAT